VTHENAINRRKVLYLVVMLRIAARLCVFLTLILSASLALSQQTQAAGVALEKTTKEDVLKELETVVTKQCFVPGVEFGKWPEFLEKHREEVDKAETDVAFVREVNKVLRDFGVSHIRFRTPKAAEQRASGTTSGLGMQVKKVDAGLEVTAVAPQGPAAALGIGVGDVITEVEHKPVTDTAAIQVEVGKTIAVKVLKKGGETKELTLENKTFSNRRPETLTWIGEDAAVLKLYTFANGYDRKNVETLITEANKKAKYLIIDLRSNGGGAVSSLNHFLSLLMPDGTPLGTFISRATADEYAKSHTDGQNDPLKIAAWQERKYKTSKRSVEPFTGKIAVLINRGSASASEIACAALKECRDAVVLGANSAGAVLASVYKKLPGGFELQYPLQDYVTIKGVRLEANPRVPDVALERSADGKDDAADKAIELLKKKAAEHSSTAGPSGHGLSRAA
jgi:carboxyl-terminal processing protease